MSAAVFFAAGAGLWIWLQQYEESVAVEILAPSEPDFALPVYAQFYVTQFIELPQPMEITKLIVPMYLPSPGQLLIIELKQAGEIIQRWRLRLPDMGSHDVPLEFDRPWTLSGQLSVMFDGQTIDHNHREQAPRLFFESADAAYPAGHYRIAQNDKQGDIGLSIIARQRRWHRFQTIWHEQPLLIIEQLSLLLTIVALLSALPPVLLIYWVSTNPRTT